MRRFLLTSCMSAALLCLPVTAWSADSVSVRTSPRDGYSRLVFDWGQSVPYTVNKVGDDTLEVSFQKAGTMDASGVEAQAATIKGVEKISSDTENLKVRVRIPAGSNFRQFSIGNKIILDVYGNVKAADAAAKPAPAPSAVVKPSEKKEDPAPLPKPVAKIEPKTESKPEPEVKVAEAKPVVKPETKIVEVKPAPKAEEKKAEIPVKAEAVAHVTDTPPVPVIPPVVSTADKPPVAAVPASVENKEVLPPVVELSVLPLHVVTISSTNTVGMAVFQRNDDLWIVLDRSDITVPPQLTGPQKDKFKPFEKITGEGGVAYRTRLPEGVHVSGEGGGLVWKINLTPKDSGKEAIEPVRNFAPGENIRGGTLFWPMQRVTRVVKLKDPGIGDTILVGTVDNSNQVAGAGRDLVDAVILDSPIGLAIVPKVDDVTMQPVGNGVQVTRPGGLALTRTRDMVQKTIQDAKVVVDPAHPAMKRIFDFDRWMMGGLQALRENQQILLSGLAPKDKTGRTQDLLMLAKMNMANDRGQEAVGFLNFAEAELPEISQSPEFLALRGAAEAMAGKFEMALNDLSTPVLRDYGELDYWRAYTLAGLEDWQQAKDVLPKNLDVLKSYPLKIQERLILKLAELALRSGNITATNDLISALEQRRAAVQTWTHAGMEYLSGEKHRQANEIKQAEDSWTPLTKSKDDLYRVKANLALTMLQLQNKQITNAQAIDRLEGLRYHWRGDELEAQVNFMLGKFYIADGRYQKAYTIMKDSAEIVPEADITHDIVTYMAKSFADLFLSDQLNKMSPVDAAAMYEDFPELMPPGENGNKIINRLAERLVDADLLDRAALLMNTLINGRMIGQPAGDVALRLAAIDLLNDNPQAAMVALDKANAIYGALPATPEIAKKQYDVTLLRARALSKMDKVAEALAILNKFPPAPEVNRLRADIAWNAGMWGDAAEALQNLIIDEPIDVARPLTQKQADLILNRSVALNLSGDRVALSNMRTKYADMMDKTSRAKMFDVVTRQRTGSLSSDRESIAALVSEVDLFKDFLDSYRADTAKPSN